MVAFRPSLFNLTDVWLWEDFPSRGDLGGRDTGIDLVARADNGEYWAIQCKCYKEDAVIDKPAVDSFLATSSRQFLDVDTLQTTSFAHRLWISTTNHWGNNAEEAIKIRIHRLTAWVLLTYKLRPSIGNSCSTACKAKMRCCPVRNRASISSALCRLPLSILPLMTVANSSWRVAQARPTQP